MSYLVYNDFKQNDFAKHDLSNIEIIVNNISPMTKGLVKYLNKNTKKWWYCLKLYKGVDHVKEEIKMIHNLKIKNISVDAENYTQAGKPYMKYNYMRGCRLRAELVSVNVQEIILLPENLGGDRYKYYDEFVKGLMPSSILMERAYTQPEPWNMLFFYLKNKNKYKRYEIDVYLGIWPESVSNFWRPIQKFMAKILAGDKIFWYSEKKEMPK